MATPQSTDATRASLPTGDWRIVPADSELGFQTRIMFGLIPVRGRYSSYEGELRIDDAGHATGSLQIEAASVATGIKKRDAHLRSNDFFAVEEHPHLRFELTALGGDGDDVRTATGTLHIRDQELPIKAPLTLAQADGDRIRIDADFDVDHGASGLGWKRVPPTIHVVAALVLERAR